MASDFEYLEILGARHAARTQLLARSLHESSGPAHPDFEAPTPPGALGADADLAASLGSRDVHVEFALMRHVVDRMRAAFFHERS